jgi:mono/diheme cytochrome c family protein
LRTLAERYPVTGLAEAFAQGIMVGHPNMPNFRFSPAEINEILAYLQTIQTRQGAALDRPRSGHSPLVRAVSRV